MKLITMLSIIPAFFMIAMLTMLILALAVPMALCRAVTWITGKMKGNSNRQ